MSRAMTPVRLALIGAGRWGQVYLRTLPALADRCRLTHLVTRRPAPADAPGTVQRLDDWRRAIASDCDAVIIATPPPTHAEILRACLDARKPCIVEKPLCLDVATAHDLRDRARRANVPVLVDHTHLFSDAYQLLRRRVQQDGEPIRTILGEGSAFGPFRRHTAPLWDRGPHEVSLCLDLVGEPPRAVAALGGPATPAGDAEQVSLRLDFAAATAWLHTGSCWPVKRRLLTVLTSRHAYCWNDVPDPTVQVAEVDVDGRYTRAVPEPLPWTSLPLAPGPRPMVRMLRYFLNALAGGDARYMGLDIACDAVAVLAHADAALCAAAPRPSPVR